jgi:hypothetical protein
MKKLLFILSFIITNQFFAQTTINGKVTDAKGVAVIGANVYLEGTYDGSTTDDNGVFSFTTNETGTQTLKISYISYEAFTMLGDVSYMKNLI